MVAGALAIFAFVVCYVWFMIWLIWNIGKSIFSSNKPNDAKLKTRNDNVVIIESDESEEDRCYREYGEYYDQSYYF